MLESLQFFYRAIQNQKFLHRLWTSAQTFPIWPWSLSLRLGLGLVLESLSFFTELSKIEKFHMGCGPEPTLFQFGPAAFTCSLAWGLCCKVHHFLQSCRKSEILAWAVDQSPSFSNFAGQLFGEAGFGALLPQEMESGLTLMFRIKPQFKSWKPWVNPDRACFRINRNLYWNYKEKANLSFWKPYFHFRRFRVIPDPDLALVRIVSAPIGRAVANQILSHRLWTWTFIFPIWSYYLSLKLGFGFVLGNG